MLVCNVYMCVWCTYLEHVFHSRGFFGGTFGAAADEFKEKKGGLDAQFAGGDDNESDG